MRLRLALFALAAGVTLACGSGASAPRDLNLLVLQPGDLPDAYRLVEEGAQEGGAAYRVVYETPDGKKTIVSEVRRLDSKKESFAWVAAESARLTSDGYSAERAKDLGDLNYSFSRFREVEDTEYVMVFAQGDMAAHVSVRGEGVIFGDIYVVSRYMMHHLDPSEPTPETSDELSEERT